MYDILIYFLRLKGSIISFCLLAHLSLNAQVYDSTIVLGAKVPDIKFDNVINYQTCKIALSDLKGKLVIIDYWATWCTSCIKTFDKLDSIQMEFRDQLQIILVNNSKGSGDTKVNVEQFFKRQKANKREMPDIPIVVEDTLSTLYFPHTFIPHCVWIAPDGSLFAVTSSSFVTKEIIHSILDDGKIKGSLKDSFSNEIGRVYFDEQ